MTLYRLTTPSGIYGPFKSIEILPDRYTADGADLPLSVVGSGAIDEWVGPLPALPQPPLAVPASVTMRQARLALLGAGLLDGVEAAIAALPSPQKEAAKIEWEYSQEVQRHNGFVLVLSPMLGMTAEQTDALFVQAATL